MDAAQEDGLWRAIGNLEGEVDALRERSNASPLQRPFRLGLGLAAGAALGISLGVLVGDHVRDLKNGLFEPVQIEVYPRWQIPYYEPITEFDL
jgi:hypothetical protein